MASTDDILTTQKNGVTAINGLITSYNKQIGTFTSPVITTETVIATTAGRLINFSVVVGGSGAGTISNSNATGAASSAVLTAIPTNVGIYPAGLFFTNGLVVKPGSGQSVNVTYYLGS